MVLSPPLAPPGIAEVLVVTANLAPNIDLPVNKIWVLKIDNINDKISEGMYDRINITTERITRLTGYWILVSLSNFSITRIWYFKSDESFSFIYHFIRKLYIGKELVTALIYMAIPL